MSAFPAINADGVITQYPYTETDEFLTLSEQAECGKTYTYGLNATAIRRFKLSYSIVTPTEVAVIETFFNTARGRLGEFTFTDDAGTTYPKVRFDQDEFRAEYRGPNEYSIEMLLKVIP